MVMGRVTLRDVAKHAGVSVGSVSRFLNNHPSLSDKARTAIEGAIKKLKYTPNQMAQKLARGVSRNLLLYIYQEFPIVNTTWMFELPIIHGIYDYLQKTNYTLQIAIGSIFKPDQFREYLFGQIESRQVDGMLILSAWPPDKSAVIRLMDSGFPYVLIGNANQVDSHNSIIFDNEEPIADLVTQLCRQGHRDFAFIGGHDTQMHTRERYDGFKRGLAEFGLKPKPEWVKYGDYSYESGIELMNQILAKKTPSAVIAGNDFIAAGAIRSIRNHGLKVPDDISVTGFDNVTVANIVDPELTTVKVPLFEMGRLATEKLVNSINSKEVVFPSEKINCEIIVRDSTAAQKKR